MSSRIQILSKPLINQIAAGEVVERPASVVKELVENSIDAGATSIEVHLLESGKKQIRVRDNGHGMDQEDVRLSIERHATSKIKELHDLFKVKTLGFRGEALPSIASVSKVTLSTKTQDSPATRLWIEGGEKIKEEMCGAPVGTEVLVQDLFFNTPARLKFLKSDATELSHCTMVVEELSLSHPHISFRLTHEKKEIFYAPKTQHILERILAILGDQQSSYLCVEEHSEVVSVKAYVSLPRFVFPTSKFCHLFINGRPIHDRTLLHAVSAAYQNLIPHGHYPKAVLFLEIDGEFFDVNVHPTKREVRFKDSRSIHRFIEQSIQRVLQKEKERVGIPLITLEDVREGVENSIQSFHQRSDSHFSFYPPDYRTHSGRTSEIHEPPFQTDSFQYSKWSYIGQIKNSYILCESSHELLFIDQHAAHERLLFEKFKKQWEQTSVEQQYLLVPLSLELTASEAIVIGELLSSFERLGFEIEPFGGTTFVVKAVPRVLQERVTSDFLRSMLHELAVLPKTLLGESLFNHVLATMACHSARTAHEKLERDEIMALLASLDHMDQAPHCPHGRPFSFCLPIAEIEKKFKR